MFSGLSLIFYNTWRNLPRRAHSLLPTLQDVKAHHLAPVLSHVWIMRFEPPCSMMVRFVGTAAERVRGDTTGDDFLQQHIATEHRAYVLNIYRNVAAMPCAAILTRIAPRRNEAPEEIASTILPLTDATEGHWSIIGVTEISRQHVSAESSGYYDLMDSNLNPPHYVDLGHGIPSLDTRPPATKPANAAR